MMGARESLLFLFILVILGDETSTSGRTKRQFSFSFGLPNFGGGGNDGGGSGGGGGNDRQNPFDFLGGIFNQIVRPNNNNQGGNNQGGNNQGQPGVLGNVNIGGIPIQVSSQNGGIGFSIAQGNCGNNNGGCEQGCRVVNRQRQCFCNNGFFLRQDRRTCEDINECQQGNNGGCSDICNNNPGSFNCTCNPGRILQSDLKTCAGGGGGQGGIQNCNECQQLCLTRGFDMKCSCIPGYSLGRDGKSCLQLDLCVENNGGCAEICNSNGGSRVCSCGPGKQLRNDGVRCRDINECRTNNGGCQQICRNTPGSFRCFCRNGFTLTANGQCQANQQPTTTSTTTQKPTLPLISTPSPSPPAPSGRCGENTKKSLITRIVGGKPADPKDWPWMAAFLQRSGNTQYCGGTLITDRHVLTAAHCMRPFSARDILVRLGEYDFRTTNDNSPQNFNVADIKMHERYNSNTQENDIALVKLDRTVAFNDFIKPACLPEPGRSFAGSFGYVTGWGTIYSGGPVSNVLQEVIIPVWQPNECSAAYPNKIFPGMMCAGTKRGGKDSCQGDSGGPYQVQIFPNRRWFIAGIVSWGIGCAKPEKPGVYTEVTKYLDWIRSNARQ